MSGLARGEAGNREGVAKGRREGGWRVGGGGEAWGTRRMWCESPLLQRCHGEREGAAEARHTVGVALQGEGRTQERNGESPHGRQGEPKVGMVEEN